MINACHISIIVVQCLKKVDVSVICDRYRSYEFLKCKKCVLSVPGRPAGIKALPINNSSISASWQPPRDPNGVITFYNLYYSNTSAAAQVPLIELANGKRTAKFDLI